jgi:hypothetical protein
MPEPITTKRRFYDLWERGLLGNKPRTWVGIEALRASGYTGLVTARSTGQGGGWTKYGVTVRDGEPFEIEEAVVAGAPVKIRHSAVWPGVTYNESAPDDLLLIQGEVARVPGGLYLRFDRTPGLKMREAMKIAKDATGLTAKLMLQHLLWPASYDEVMDLLDAYPDHVIEFSAYDVACGNLPHRNTLVWEVRRY